MLLRPDIAVGGIEMFSFQSRSGLNSDHFFKNLLQSFFLAPFQGARPAGQNLAQRVNQKSLRGLGLPALQVAYAFDNLFRRGKIFDKSGRSKKESPRKGACCNYL